MNEERGQFTFYRSFWDAMNQLPQKEQLPFVKALCAYAFTGEEEANLRGGAAASFLLVKPILDKASKKAANGKKGGSKPKAKMKQTENYKEREEEKETENEKEVEIEIENESYNFSSAPSKDSAFERFWAVYPRKIGKSEAKRSFSKLKGVSTDTLIAAVERQKQSLQWQKENGAYIPNPATWLNQGRWEDELPTTDYKGTVPQTTCCDEKALESLRKAYERVKNGG